MRSTHGLRWQPSADDRRIEPMHTAVQSGFYRFEEMFIL